MNCNSCGNRRIFGGIGVFNGQNCCSGSARFPDFSNFGCGCMGSTACNCGCNYDDQDNDYVERDTRRSYDRRGCCD